MSEDKKIEKKDPKGRLDTFIARVVSRKLMVWSTATLALFMGVLSSEQWVEVSLLYIGSQAVVDLAATYVKSRNS